MIFVPLRNEEDVIVSGYWHGLHGGWPHSFPGGRQAVLKASDPEVLHHFLSQDFKSSGVVQYSEYLNVILEAFGKFTLTQLLNPDVKTVLVPSSPPVLFYKHKFMNHEPTLFDALRPFGASREKVTSMLLPEHYLNVSAIDRSWAVEKIKALKQNLAKSKSWASTKQMKFYI